MMFLTNSVMALTAIVSTVLGFGLMILIIRKSQKYFVGQQQYLGQLNGHIEEIYTGHNVVKAYNGEQAASKKHLRPDQSEPLQLCLEISVPL